MVEPAFFVSDSDALPCGTVLNEGRYCIEGVLGHGGFGIIYGARDGRTGRQVAIKEFFPPSCHREAAEVVSTGNLEAWERSKQAFGRGASTMGKLCHPAIVRVYEHFAENGTLYAVMELLCGHTLLQALQDGPLPEAEAVRIVEGLAGALDAVHRMRLLHLDIKPENVMVCAEAGGELRVVLFDFDLLQEVDRANDARTRPLGATQGGTPGYAPLEQYSQCAPLSGVTDIYALGATFYHLLTGAPPPAASDRALGLEVRPPREIVGTISRPCTGAVMRALEMQPSARPQSVADFLAILHGESKPAPAFRAYSAPPPSAPAPKPQTGVEGWFLLATLNDDPIFPDTCACCGAVAVTDWPLREAGREWLVPYCKACERHVRNGVMASKGANWGMFASFGTAVLGVGLVAADAPVAGIVLTPPAVVFFFTAMAYGALKGQVADAQMRSHCTTRDPAVANGGRTGHGAGPHLWKFKSQAYAEAFARENGANVVPLK